MVAACRFVVVSIPPGLLRYSGVKTYAQAMRAGKCVVVNDPAGAASYIEHGKTGFLVKPGDPAALRAQICALLASPETAAEVGANARRVAVERFSAEAYLRALRAVLAEIAGAPA
jgi:glycosyltransferase involved in cell wall biosynthesis